MFNWIFLAALFLVLFMASPIGRNLILKMQEQTAARRIAELTSVQKRIEEAHEKGDQALLKELKTRERELIRLLNKEG